MVVHFLESSLGRVVPRSVPRSVPGGVNGGGRRHPRVGFVVSKAVGGAVTRNQVKRRLRHLARERTTWLLGHDMLVVRALPGAAHTSYGELARELDRCLTKLGVTAERTATKEGSR